MSESTVHLTATLTGGGEMDYTITMVRDGIGWKVSAVTPVYLSQPDGAQDDSDTGADAPADTTTDVVAHDDAVDGAEGTAATSGTDSDSADATSPEEPATPADPGATGSDAAAATE